MLVAQLKYLICQEVNDVRVCVGMYVHNSMVHTVGGTKQPQMHSFISQVCLSRQVNPAHTFVSTAHSTQTHMCTR